VTWRYNEYGWAISSELAGGQDLNSIEGGISSSPLGGQVEYENKNFGNKERLTSRSRSATDNCPAAEQSYTYTGDDAALLTSRTDWQGTQTTYEYNDRGLKTLRTQAVGTPQERETVTDWDPELPRVLKTIKPGRTTEYGYDSSGRVQSVKVGNRITTYAYDSSGNVTSVDGPRTDVNDVTLFEYGARGNLSKVTNALGHVTLVQDYTDYGLPQKLIDPNGVESQLAYTARGWLTSSTVKSRDGDAQTLIAYTPTGLVQRITQPNGRFIEFTYDLAERLIGITNNQDDSIIYALDEAGNRISETVVDGGGGIEQQRSRVFDELDRLLEDVGADSQITRFSYDSNGNVTKITDPKAQPTGQGYDALNRLVSLIDPLKGITQLDYDARDNLTSVSDPRSLTTTYTYNEHNQVVTQVSPDTGTTTFAYDAAGNVIRRTDARAVVIEYTYDALNRLTAQTYPADSSFDINYSYDANTLNPQAGESYNAGIGRLTSITDNTANTTFSYDDRGNLTAMRQAVSVGGNQSIDTTGYGYDLTNMLTSVIYPSGLTVNYTRDALGRIDGVTASYTTESGPVNNAPILSNIDYQAFGTIKSGTYGNGLKLSRTFDSDGRLSTHTVTGVMDYGFVYDANGNITEISDGLNPILTGNYEYDPLDRLNEENKNSEAKAYDYDAVGNRTQIRNPVDDSILQANQYGTTSNRLVNQDGTPIQFDPVGNIVDWDTKGWTYDLRNRMSAYKESGTTKATYEYNGLGQRIKKTRTDQSTERTTLLHFNAAGQIIQETIIDQVNNPVETRSYIWFDAMPVAYLKQIIVNSNQVSQHTLVYLHTDQLNTPRVGTNAAANIIWRWDSDTFGVGDAEEIQDGTGVLAAVNLRMPGQFYDEESQTFYNYYRDYKAELGRYLQSDPLGLAAETNTYSYVSAHPLSRSDSYGLLNDNSFYSGLRQSEQTALRHRNRTRPFCGIAPDTPPLVGGAISGTVGGAVAGEILGGREGAFLGGVIGMQVGAVAAIPGSTAVETGMASMLGTVVFDAGLARRDVFGTLAAMAIEHYADANPRAKAIFAAGYGGLVAAGPRGAAAGIAGASAEMYTNYLIYGDSDREQCECPQ
jgi:RHS repeat-associated protein